MRLIDALQLCTRGNLCGVELCRREKIIIKLMPLDEGISACLLITGGHRYALVNSSLTGDEQCEAIYHELGHYYHRDKEKNHSPFDKQELRARLFALALKYLGCELDICPLCAKSKTVCEIPSRIIYPQAVSVWTQAVHILHELEMDISGRIKMLMVACLGHRDRTD